MKLVKGYDKLSICFDVCFIGKVRLSMLHLHGYLRIHFSFKRSYSDCLLYVLDEADMDRVFKLPSTTFIGEKEKALPLR